MNAKHWASGLMSALMTCTGGAILIVHTATNLGLNERQLLSWFFVCYAIGGLLNLWLAWRFRLPIAGAHSVTGIAFLSSASMSLSLSQLVGGYILAGLIIALLGLTGIFNVIFKHIPRPVIDAMLAGIIAHYIIDLVPSFQQNPLVGLLAVLGFFVLPKLIKPLPAIVGVIVFGIIGLLFTYSFPQLQSFSYQLPTLITPEFSLDGLISIALPISILVLSNDIAVALASLHKQGYSVPTNRIITYSGLGSMIGGLGLGHSVNIGGMMTTMCSSEETGEKDKRYIAGIISSLFCIIFGLLSWLILPYIIMLPSYFIASLIGYSLLNIFVNSMRASFGHPNYRYASLFSFIIAAAGITMLGISAALWSLIVGTCMAKLLKEQEPNMLSSSSNKSNETAQSKV